LHLHPEVAPGRDLELLLALIELAIPLEKKAVVLLDVARLIGVEGEHLSERWDVLEVLQLRKEHQVVKNESARSLSHDHEQLQRLRVGDLQHSD